MVAREFAQCCRLVLKRVVPFWALPTLYTILVILSNWELSHLVFNCQSQKLSFHMSENWSWEAKVVEVKLNTISRMNWLHRPSQLCSLLKRWLIPNPLTQIPRTSKIKHVKAAIVLVIWVTFLALAFWVTLPPMVHPIIVEVFGWTINSQPT